MPPSNANSRLRSIMKRGRYAFTCLLCGGLDHEDMPDELDREHCVDCELILWDSLHMVENDNGAKSQLKLV